MPPVRALGRRDRAPRRKRSRSTPTISMRASILAMRSSMRATQRPRCRIIATLCRCNPLRRPSTTISAICSANCDSRPRRSTLIGGRWNSIPNTRGRAAISATCSRISATRRVRSMHFAVRLPSRPTVPKSGATCSLRSTCRIDRTPRRSRMSIAHSVVASRASSRRCRRLRQRTRGCDCGWATCRRISGNTRSRRFSCPCSRHTTGRHSRSSAITTSRAATR